MMKLLLICKVMSYDDPVFHSTFKA